MQFDELKTIAVDITYSVFKNDKLAVLYVTKDNYSDSYVAAVPVIHLVKQIWGGNEANGYESLLQSDIGIEQPERKEKLVEVIKQVIEKF